VTSPKDRWKEAYSLGLTIQGNLAVQTRSCCVHEICVKLVLFEVPKIFFNNKEREREIKREKEREIERNSARRREKKTEKERNGER
jgi:hypothetical protein